MLRKLFILLGEQVFVSTSIGIALTAPGYQRPEDLLRDAETAMYRAKANGKARHEIFDNRMHAHVLSLLKLEADLRQALDRQEFCLEYQPIVSLATGKITSVEALIRWQRPEHGFLYPASFIDEAEDCGLIVPIGAWVLRTACSQIRLRHQAGYKNLGVSVNISARQFYDEDLPRLVKDVLRDSCLPARCLELEITERVAMQDVDLTIQTLQELTEIGVKVAMDDFGHGYSALGYLRRYPLNTLKIDRSFLSELSEKPEDAGITTAIVAIGHVLHLNVIAEGVETPEQLEFLASQECDHVQGFLISRPLPPGELTTLLEAGDILLPETSQGLRFYPNGHKKIGR